MITDIFIGLFEVMFKTAPLETALFAIVFLILFYLLFANGKITHLKHVAIDHFIVKEEMQVAEQRGGEIEEDVLSLYLRLKKEATGTKRGLIDNDDVRNFRLLLKYIKKKALRDLHHSFVENHLAERENYEMWIDKRADEILAHMREILNTWYGDKDAPDLETFFDKYVVEKRPLVKEGIKMILREAREITLNFNSRKYVNKYIKAISRRIRG